MVDRSDRHEQRSAVALIVEDHALTRRSLERAASTICTPVGCASFEQAMSTIDAMTARPFALIVDVHLGSVQHDGLDLLDHVRARFSSHVPALVLTGTTSQPEVSSRAHELRATFLAKPQHATAIRTFLEHARILNEWAVPDVIALHHAVERFATMHDLTRRQRTLLYTLMQAAERGERDTMNPNTRKAAVRRILERTGLASFEDVRVSIKKMARS